MITANSKERTRFLKFATVGAIGAVIDFGIFNFLTLLNLVSPIVASVISFIVAVISNFLGNRYWTYPDSRSKSIGRQGTQFVLVSLVGLIIRTPLFAFLEIVFINLGKRIIPPNTISPIFVGHNLALASAIIVVMLWNFLANRLWTYSDVS